MAKTRFNSHESDDQFNLPLLREYLAQYFDMNELELLSFNLNVDFEDIKSENKARTTMLLVQYFLRFLYLSTNAITSDQM